MAQQSSARVPGTIAAFTCQTASIRPDNSGIQLVIAVMSKVSLAVIAAS